MSSNWRQQGEVHGGGYDGYISKPVQIAELKRALDECARAIRAGINEDSCALVLCGLLICGD